MDIILSQEACEKYSGKGKIVSNARIRPDNEDFMSVDMTPEGRDIPEAIRRLH